MATTHEQKQKKGLYVLYAVAALLAVALLAAVALLFVNSGSGNVVVAAQDDAAKLEQKKKTNEPMLDDASTSVVNLVSLMGMTQPEALAAIGHGATVQEADDPGISGDVDEVVVLLTDEKGDSKSGTPTVVLGLGADGRVNAASYSASTWLLGYGSLSLVDAVSTFHIVENTLAKAGLQGVENGSVALPSKETYSHYESDRKTLSSEECAFHGVASANGVSYLWDAEVDYDYEEANKTGNLANTVKKITVYVARS